jgi:hypothetical protein
MAVMLKGKRIRAGGGGGCARHNTRWMEIERLIKSFAQVVKGERESVVQEKAEENEDGPRFWTRNMPEEVRLEDPVADLEPIPKLSNDRVGLRKQSESRPYSSSHSSPIAPASAGSG